VEAQMGAEHVIEPTSSNESELSEFILEILRNSPSKNSNFCNHLLTLVWFQHLAECPSCYFS